jgi:hypothetical protein
MTVGSCMGSLADRVDKTPYIPSDKECEWIRPQAFFPNCWNGKDAYLPGNAHMRYPTGREYEGDPCPTGFVRIPSLFLESRSNFLAGVVTDHQPTTKWPTALAPSTSGILAAWFCKSPVQTGLIVSSNGDNNGFTFHADWLNGERPPRTKLMSGWPHGMLVDAYDRCKDKLMGTVDGCSVFEASRDEDMAYNCRAQGQVIAEVCSIISPATRLIITGNWSRCSPGSVARKQSRVQLVS